MLIFLQISSGSVKINYFYLNLFVVDCWERWFQQGGSERLRLGRWGHSVLAQSVSPLAFCKFLFLFSRCLDIHLSVHVRVRVFGVCCFYKIRIRFKTHRFTLSKRVFACAFWRNCYFFLIDFGKCWRDWQLYMGLEEFYWKWLLQMRI